MAVYRIEILYDTESKKMNVNGPVGDRVLSYGLLGLARDCIHEMYLMEAFGKKEVILDPGKLTDIDRLLRGGPDGGGKKK